jgi:formamidopyrimidine-DNA glycosylase
LPDLTVVAEALHASLAGRVITTITPVAPLVLRGTPDEVQAFSGQQLMAVRRRGKLLELDLSGGRILINPMLNGRFQLAALDGQRPRGTAVILAFSPRAKPPLDCAPWTRGAPWQPEDAALAEIRYRDPTQMGKLYLLPEGVERRVPGFGPDESGPDADAPELDLERWRQRIRRHHGELKPLLRNQAFVAGIGNAYADEILHAARLLPNRKRSSLSEEEIDELYRAMRSVLPAAVEQLRERVPPTFERQVRDFLAVHLKGGSPCPRCGTRISELKAGGAVTSFCRGCQH